MVYRSSKEDLMGMAKLMVGSFYWVNIWWADSKLIKQLDNNVFGTARLNLFMTVILTCSIAFPQILGWASSQI